MKILLNVPFKEKERAKALGARWDFVLKKWFIETNKTQIVGFIEWLPHNYAHLNDPHIETKYELERRLASENNLGKKEIRRMKVKAAKEKQKDAMGMKVSAKQENNKPNLYNGDTAPWEFMGEFIECYK